MKGIEAEPRKLGTSPGKQTNARTHRAPGSVDPARLQCQEQYSWLLPGEPRTCLR